MSATAPRFTLSRLLRRAIDIGVIAIVAVIGVSSAQQVIEWMRDEPTPTASPRPDGVEPGQWGTGRVPIEIGFGNLPLRMTQEIFVGTPADAQSQLERRVLAKLKQSAVAAISEANGRHAKDETADSAAIDSEPSSDNERELRQLASGEEPLAVVPHHGAVFQFSDVLVGAFAIRFGEGAVQAEQIRNGRLTCWGLVTPGRKDEWKLYLFERTRSERVDSPVEIPAPPGGARTLALGDRVAGHVVTFRGTGPLDQWQDHFDTWFGQQGYEVINDWRGSSSTKSASWHKPTAKGADLADVRLVRDNRGSLSALLQLYEIHEQ